MYRWFLSQGAPIYSANGELYGYVGSGIDITAHKLLEQELTQSEERFQAAVEAIEGVLWTNNPKGEMEGIQTGWAALTGQSFEEYQGLGWANAVQPDDVRATIKAWNESV